MAPPFKDSMVIELKPIGFVETDAATVPRHWSVSDLEGRLVIDPKFKEGLKDIQPGQKLVVLFYFDRSPAFTPDRLVQKPPHLDKRLGVFSTCSPVRPNPLGMSILEVLEIRENVIRVKGVDMLDGTPILDLKPFVPPAAEDSDSGERKA
jgi:tRNA-Thr(GGU) m(6)t(6)A37 methyltransferase TsaA